MRNKCCLIWMLLFCCLQGTWAQNTVESIRKRYASVKEYIASHVGTNENDGAEWAEFYHLEARQFLPATGGHKEDVYMYWMEREEDKIYPSHYLIFATTKYNYSDREMYEEYLYDKDGKVAFIYAHDPSWSLGENSEDKEYEFRFYFNKGKLLKTIIKNREFEQGDYKDVYSGSTPKSEYASYCKMLIDKAEKIRLMFIAIEKEAYNYSE